MGISPSLATSVVFDASALIRAFVDQEPEAVAWLDRVADGEARPAWPVHLYAEVAHSLIRLTRARRLERQRATEALERTLSMPAHIPSPKALVDDALAVGLERGVSAYDALYVVVAEALDAPLVTADRRLAGATSQAVLLPG